MKTFSFSASRVLFEHPLTLAAQGELQEHNLTYATMGRRSYLRYWKCLYIVQVSLLMWIPTLAIWSHCHDLESEYFKDL